MAKYTIVAYLFWLFLGFLGAHHFYLGRDRQGLLWLTSFGGIFSVGWIRDLTRIPAYVREANEDAEFLLRMNLLMRRRKRPSIWANITRVIAGVFFGLFYRALVLSSLPEEYATNGYLVFLLLPLGTTFGTHMVSNVGSIKSHWKYALIGAYLGEVLFGFHHFLLEDSSMTLAVSISMLFSTFGWEFDRQPRARHLVQGGGGAGGRCCRGRVCCRRVALWTLVLVVYTTLLVSTIYFNANITTEKGEKIKLREAINNFFKSPAWKQLKKSFWANLWDVWDQYKKDGWTAAHKRLMVLADFQGEERSRFVLGVGENATLSEVKSKYRTLAREWHPDRHQGDSDEEKARVQEKFMEIKEAYETLQKLYKVRESRGWFRDRSRG